VYIIEIEGFFRNFLDLNIKFTQAYLAFPQEGPNLPYQYLLRHENVHYLVSSEEVMMATLSRGGLPDTT